MLFTIRRPALLGTLLLVVASNAFSVRAFLTLKQHHSPTAFGFGHRNIWDIQDATPDRSSSLVMFANNKLDMVEGDLEPIPFTEAVPSSKGEQVVECFVDAVATIGNTQYSVGHVCDHAIDVVFIDDEDELVPIEIEDDLMNDIFPLAVKAMKEEFPDCTLLRTPATLTLQGDLGDEDEADKEDEDDGATAELLVTFEHEGTEYNIIRPLDLMLLVATTDENNPDQRILINDDEAEEVMPTLMEMLGV